MSGSLYPAATPETAARRKALAPYAHSMLALDVVDQHANH